MLHRKGWLFAKRDLEFPELADRLCRSCLCPCCGARDAFVLGPELHVGLELGALVCWACTKTYGKHENASTVEALMTNAYKAAADDAIAAALGYEDVTQAFDAARVDLEAVLPKYIDLGWARDHVLRAAIGAVRRYDAQFETDPSEALPEVALWFRKSRIVGTLPAWLWHSVRQHFMRERAVAKLEQAFDRLTLKLGRMWLYAHELEREELKAVEAARADLDWVGTSRRSIGKLLAHFTLKPGQPGPGFRRLGTRAGPGYRWEFIRSTRSGK